jgi:DNA helicase-2/ATP-dependent DNA helicase PcrA
VVDRDDAKELLAACIGEAPVDTTATRFPKPEVLGDIFSKAINTGSDLATIIADEYPSFLALTEPIRQLQKQYAQRKRAAGLMDFDDLLVLWLNLLRSHEDICEVYQRRFQFVLVDEYQDTNLIQGELLETLSGRHGNLMAVGDDAQSIYSWRGANFANIIDYPQRHASARVFKIETNYRSTPEILAVANAVISGNVRQFPKLLTPARESGPKPVVVVCGDASEQARFLAQRILELRDEGVSLGDMCVLYRSHFHALELQLELTRRNIAFVITSGLRFFEQAHIKDVAAYLKLTSNPFDELAFKRLAKMMPGIGAKGADKLWAQFRAELEAQAAFLPEATPTVAVPDVDGGDWVPTDSPVAPVAPILASMAPKIPKKAAVAWAQFTASMAQAEQPGLRRSPARLLRHFMEAEYRTYAEATFDNWRNRLEDLEQLASYAQQFNSTSEFLAQLALQTNLEAEAESNPKDAEDRLRLSTIHQAKGLEFGVVFVIMLCDGLFPSAWSLEERDGLEEERRLFYVAVTRAKNELYLSYPLLRYSHGAGATFQQASRFLGEIPSQLIEEWNLRPAFGAPQPPKTINPRLIAEDLRDADITADPEPGDDPF